MDEYRALRTEIVESIQAQRTIMQVGTTGAAVLIGFGLQQIDSLPGALILTLLVPIVSIFTTVGSIGELYRAARASCYLAQRERVFKDAFAWDAPAMDWERWLRERPTFSLREWAEFLALLAITTGAVALGVHAIAQADPPIATTGALVAIIVGSAALWIVHLVLHPYLLGVVRKQYRCRELETKSSSGPGPAVVEA